MTIQNSSNTKLCTGCLPKALEEHHNKKYVPTERELLYYKNSDKEPIPFVEKLLKDKSREEQLMASERIMDLIDLAKRVVERGAGEREVD
ncbi:hypothetical protein [Kordia antarctica]|nr:hypothetical protein [Kordia antarctica]